MRQSYWRSTRPPRRSNWPIDSSGWLSIRRSITSIPVSAASPKLMRRRAVARPAANPPSRTIRPRCRRATKRISPATQAAAAEAWCLVLAASAEAPVDGLAPAGRALERVNLPNSVRAELFRGVAAWVPPRAHSRLENALRQGEKKSRAPRRSVRQPSTLVSFTRSTANERSWQAPPPELLPIPSDEMHSSPRPC